MNNTIKIFEIEYVLSKLSDAEKLAIRREQEAHRLRYAAHPLMSPKEFNELLNEGMPLYDTNYSKL